jgi:hypothetical protein
MKFQRFECCFLPPGRVVREEDWTLGKRVESLSVGTSASSKAGRSWTRFETNTTGGYNFVLLFPILSERMRNTALKHCSFII